MDVSSENFLPGRHLAPALAGFARVSLKSYADPAYCGSDRLGDKVSDKEELRQGLATDVAAIRDLTRAAYAKWVPVIGREPKPMTADYAEALRKHRFDLLYVEGKLVALIETIREADHLLIENVAVAPPFWGRGFGRKLIAHAEKMTASAGLSETRLYANKLFAENIQLYGKLGYRVDREEALKSGVVVHMRKPVESSQ